MKYWGKASKHSKSEAIAWHRLEFHCLDVAASLSMFLNAKPKLLEVLEQICGLEPNEAKKRLLICAALHDIGKFANNFQNKIPELCVQFGHQAKDSPLGHGHVGDIIWKEIRDDFSLDSVENWLYAAFSHHGTPVGNHENPNNLICKAQMADVKNFIAGIVKLFGEPSDFRIKSDIYSEWLVSGLIIIADWIGSNTEFFEYDISDISIEEYWQKALKKADAAINYANISDIAISESLEIFDLLGVKAVASPLQEWAISQKIETKPQLYIFEDLTGAGKTEAALLLAHRLMKAGNGEGIYWALPSQASANSLYDRIAKYYHKLFKDGTPSLVLAHSARDINENFQLSIKDISEYGRFTDDQDISAETFCTSFIADDRKKTFLSHVGIGTLDQALLGVLPVRHQSLRLMGLARKILIIDEAHAYDPYVNQGLVRLLKFHRWLGGSAIILSATLTKKQKIDFSRPYYGDGFDPQDCGIENKGFPLVTKSANQTKTEEYKVSSVRGTRRDLKFERIESPQIAEAKILEIAKSGDCVIYIRNSVREATESFERLRQVHNKTQLFHSRFCLGDRNEIETDILKRFGKTGTSEDRRGQIIIATQVFQESIDASLDFMFTDLAPIDILIQRAGRLQRHAREEVSAEPILHIVGNSAEGDIKADWFSSVFSTGQYVYTHTAELWRTMNVLEGSGGINLLTGSPRDYIEQVFDENGFIPPALEKFSLKEEGVRDSKKGIASLNFLGLKDFTLNNKSWASDVKTPTRLGEENIIAQLAIWENGILKPMFEKGVKSWRYSQIQIAAKRINIATLHSNHPEIKAAITKHNENWKKKYEPPIIIAFEQIGDGLFETKLIDLSGKEQILQYSKELGLQFYTTTVFDD